MATGYDPQEIEPRWQQAWDEAGLFVADDHSDKPAFYAYGRTMVCNSIGCPRVLSYSQLRTSVATR